MDNFREIIFSGRNLRYFGLVLKKDNSLIDFAENSLELMNIKGSLIGDVISGDRSRKNVEKTLTFKTLPNEITYPEDKYIKLLTDWLNNVGGYYHTFEDSARSGYETEALLKSVGSIKKSFDKCYEISMTFSIRPYWHKKTGLKWVERSFVSSGTLTLINPENFEAFPFITVDSSTTGTDGGFTLYINRKPFAVSSLTSGGIQIDSERMRINPCTYAASNDLPYFVQGENSIVFSGNSAATFNLEIQPRWRVY